MRASILLLLGFGVAIAGCAYQDCSDERSDRVACHNNQKQLLIEIIRAVEDSKGKDPFEKVIAKIAKEHPGQLVCPISKSRYEIRDDFTAWSNPNKADRSKPAICCKCKHCSFVGVNYRAHMLTSNTAGLDSGSWDAHE